MRRLERSTGQRQADTNRTTDKATLAGQRPNIVLIVMDDMGFSDPGCHGADIDRYLEHCNEGCDVMHERRWQSLCAIVR